MTRHDRPWGRDGVVRRSQRRAGGRSSLTPGQYEIVYAKERAASAVTTAHLLALHGIAWLSTRFLAKQDVLAA